MDKEKKVKILYTNWKNETRYREVIPVSIEFKATEWHKEENALDVEKQEMRGFAMKDVKSWEEV